MLGMIFEKGATLPIWDQWAEDWLTGKDRSRKSADAVVEIDFITLIKQAIEE